MKILFINNDGGGFADYIDVAESTSVRELFQQRLPDAAPEGYLIRVKLTTPVLGPPDRK